MMHVTQSDVRSPNIDRRADNNMVISTTPVLHATCNWLWNKYWLNVTKCNYWTTIGYTFEVLGKVKLQLFDSFIAELLYKYIIL